MCLVYKGVYVPRSSNSKLLGVPYIVSIFSNIVRSTTNLDTIYGTHPVAIILPELQSEIDMNAKTPERETMELVLDGSSEHVAHIWSKSDISICLRYLVT